MTLVSFTQTSGPTINGGTLPAGATATFTEVGLLSPTRVNNSTITNTATVASTTTVIGGNIINGPTAIRICSIIPRRPPRPYRPRPT